MLHSNRLDLTKMRDLNELQKDGVVLSTVSNEVAKLWDSLLFQVSGNFCATETNGIQGCIDSIKAIDPEFPLTNIMAWNLSGDYENQLLKLKCELKNQCTGTNSGRKWSSYEKLHIKAFVYLLEDNYDFAVECWYDQLAKYPKDHLALQNMNMGLILSGHSREIGNIYTRCRTEMSKQDIFYPFILGYEAFGLEEKGHLNQAFDLANESLGIYSWNSWATHSIAHIYDAQNDPVKGIEYMNRTKSNWLNETMLDCHNIWHIALFHLDHDDITSALNLLDSEIIPRLNNQYNHFTMSDAVSLLTRIELENSSIAKSPHDLDLTERWTGLSTSIGTALESGSNIGFYDIHLAFALLGCQRHTALDKILDRWSDNLLKLENKIFEEWEHELFADMHRMDILQSRSFVSQTRRVIPFIKALSFYMDGDFQSCVNILYPMRKELQKFGGSHTQNDVFYQLLASALFKSGGHENLSRLKVLFLDRQDYHQYKGFYQRLEKNILYSH